MSRVYKLYLPTYLPTYRARPISRAGFSLNRRQREPPDRSCHPTPPPRPSAHHPLSPSQPRPRNVPSPPLPRTTLLERACGPCRVFVSVACLTIRVFVSAMNALSLTVNRRALHREKEREWLLSRPVKPTIHRISLSRSGPLARRRFPFTAQHGRVQNLIDLLLLSLA